MHNHIAAFVEFYFKGEKFSPSIKLDIDQYMRSSGKLPALDFDTFKIAWKETQALQELQMITRENLSAGGKQKP